MQNKGTLHSFWTQEHIPRVLDGFWRIYAALLRLSLITGKLRNELTEMVGAEDADILLSNVSTDDEMLSSLGPLVGLTEVIRGEKSREDYLEQWGHRGPFEAEAAVPRPFEDPGWLDKQIETFTKSGVDVREMLTRQRARFDSAWSRLVERYPRKATRLRKRLEKVAKVNRMREAARSEFIRLTWITRAWALRTGELTGIGDDIFFLTGEEALELLNGTDTATAYIPARRAMYERYKALPPYPLIISGRFDPFQWAADPDRSTYLYDFHQQNFVELLKSPSENIILGTPGSAGQVEGTVRCLDTPDDWDKIQQGEILITSKTNIGWTLIFPKLGGIVTDIGAALSHAAIVARELGIPAVVNCGDATTRLHTGDRVRIDGAQGTVEILSL
ncbi:PEP-utilizing enzyme [Chloroflexota bacterium]